jgi:signal transduction histidine kinase
MAGGLALIFVPRQAARGWRGLWLAMLCLAFGCARAAEPVGAAGEEWRLMEEAIERDARSVEAAQERALREARARGDKRAMLKALNTLTLMRAMQSLTAAHLEKIEAAPDLPRQLEADAVKLRQVLVNLLSNAVKLTERGEGRLHARLHEDRLAVQVSDTGVGIAEGELAQLGEAFMQAEAGRHTAEGTGLGLAISRGLVRLMGGELLLSSRLGEGTELRACEGASAQPARAPTVVPVGLRPRLQAALASLDVAAVEEALQAIRRHDVAAASTLEPPIRRFDYEGARRMLDEAAA